MSLKTHPELDLEQEGDELEMYKYYYDETQEWKLKHEKLDAERDTFLKKVLADEAERDYKLREFFEWLETWRYAFLKDVMKQEEYEQKKKALLGLTK